MGWLWPELVAAAPLFALAAGATVWQAVLSAAQASFVTPSPSGWATVQRYMLTALLHLLQPMARLLGRVGSGLTVLRRRGPRSLVLPVPRSTTVWCENWRGPERQLGALMDTLRQEGAVLVIGGECDRWDLEVRGGALGAARLTMAVEEHGGGRQLFRFRMWPRFSVEGAVAIGVFTALALGAAFDEYWMAYDLLALVALLLLGRMLFEVAYAMAAVRRAVESPERGPAE